MIPYDLFVLYTLNVKLPNKGPLWKDNVLTLI